MALANVSASLDMDPFASRTPSTILKLFPAPNLRQVFGISSFVSARKISTGNLLPDLSTFLSAVCISRSVERLVSGIVVNGGCLRKRYYSSESGDPKFIAIAIAEKVVRFSIHIGSVIGTQILLNSDNTRHA